MKIGVVSDTHNHFDEQIPGLFAGVEHILHGGDVGQLRVLNQLEQIAPVTAVGGNTDDPAFGYRPFEVLELNGRRFLIQHIVNPHALDPALEARLRREQPEVVVFGHSHKPFAEVIGGILFLNPGYAGKTRFGMERSLAILECTSRRLDYQFLKLANL